MVIECKEINNKELLQALQLVCILLRWLKKSKFRMNDFAIWNFTYFLSSGVANKVNWFRALSVLTSPFPSDSSWPLPAPQLPCSWNHAARSPTSSNWFSSLLSGWCKKSISTFTVGMCSSATSAERRHESKSSPSHHPGEGGLAQVVPQGETWLLPLELREHIKPVAFQFPWLNFPIKTKRERKRGWDQTMDFIPEGTFFPGKEQKDLQLYCYHY